MTRQAENHPQKKCNLCKNPYPATLQYFYKNKDGKDGLGPRCKSCISEVNAKRYAEDPELYKQRVKRYYFYNREARLEYLRQWRERNPGYFKRWSENNRGRRLAYQREYNERSRRRKKISFSKKVS